MDALGGRIHQKYKGEFALYKGETLLAEGTIPQIAQMRNRKVNSIKYYLTRAYKNKVNKSKNPFNRLTLVPLDYDLDEYES